MKLSLKMINRILRFNFKILFLFYLINFKYDKSIFTEAYKSPNLIKPLANKIIFMRKISLSFKIQI